MNGENDARYRNPPEYRGIDASPGIEDSNEVGQVEEHYLMCFSCGDEHPQGDLNWVDGAGKRSPRPFCDNCVEPAKKGYGDW